MEHRASSMRVLFLLDDLRAGGKEKQLANLLVGLKESVDVEPVLVCMGPDRFFEETLKAAGVPIYYFIRKFRWDLTIFVKLFFLIRKINPVVLHTTCWMTTLFVLPVSKIWRIKLVNNSIRNSFSSGGMKWKIEKLLLLLSDIRLSNSLAGLESRNLDPHNKKNVVIYNGYRMVKKHKQNINCAYFVDGHNSQKKIGMVAEFKNHKDYQTYFSAAEIILGKRKDVLFYAVGGGDNFDYYRDKYKYIDKNIIFTGRIKDAEKLISKLDVGVLTTYTEGISNAIIEYMAHKKPVVATDGGGTKELVVDGVTGFLIRPENPVILAKKIEFLLANQEVSVQMGNKGRLVIEGKFSLSQLIHNIKSLYRALVNDRHEYSIK